MTSGEFISVFTPLEGPLYRLAFHLLESEQDAQDAVQDLFLKLWNKKDSLDRVQDPGAYCFVLMRNMCIDRLRTAGFRSRDLPDIGGDGGPFESLDARESLARVMSAVEKLPDSQRRVLKMRAVEELSYKEIQERTGMDYLTLRVLLSQARRKIRKLK